VHEVAWQFNNLASAGLTIVADVAIATGPAVLCVKFVFIICKGGCSNLGAQGKLSEKGLIFYT